MITEAFVEAEMTASFRFLLAQAVGDSAPALVFGLILTGVGCHSLTWLSAQESSTRVHACIRHQVLGVIDRLVWKLSAWHVLPWLVVHIGCAQRSLRYGL